MSSGIMMHPHIILLLALHFVQRSVKKWKLCVHVPPSRQGHVKRQRSDRSPVTCECWWKLARVIGVFYDMFILVEKYGAVSDCMNTLQPISIKQSSWPWYRLTTINANAKSMHMYIIYTEGIAVDGRWNTKEASSTSDTFETSFIKNVPALNSLYDSPVCAIWECCQC